MKRHCRAETYLNGAFQVLHGGADDFGLVGGEGGCHFDGSLLSVRLVLGWSKSRTYCKVICCVLCGGAEAGSMVQLGGRSEEEDKGDMRLEGVSMYHQMLS